MDFKTFLADLKTPETIYAYQKNVAEKIKSHNLPVIVFGAAKFAKKVTTTLKNWGIEISGYTVDAKYFKANSTFLELPIYNFDELCKTPKNYVFVIGFSPTQDILGRRKKILLDDKEIFAYEINLSTVDKITCDYILDNQEKFLESYNLLADDFSRETMTAYLKAHMTHNIKDISKVVVPNQYFNDLTAPPPLYHLSINQ